MENLFAILITVVLWGLVFYVAWWALGKIALSEPWNKVATVLLVVLTLIVMVGILTGNVPLIPVTGWKK